MHSDSKWLPSMGNALWLTAACLLAAGCGGAPRQDAADSSPTDAPDVEVVDAAEQASVDISREIERGRTLERENKMAEARQVYERLAERYPDRYEPYHRLGALADRQQRFDEARQWYERALRLEPDDPEFYNDLGYSLFLQGRLEEAERELLKAVALAPTHARSRNNLGLVYGHMGQYQDAMEQFLYAGSKADAYYNLGYVLASLEDFSGAKQCIEWALEADPKHARARKALEEFRQREQTPKVAERLHARTSQAVTERERR